MQCRLSPIVILGRATVVLSVVALAGVSSGCDRTTTPSAAITSASVLPGVVVITAGPIPISPSNSCVSAGLLTPDLAVVVSSTGATLAVDHITLHMLDGTNLGGPGVTSAVTFGQTDLNAQFVNTFVRGGTSRTFALHPTFRCSVSGPRSVQGEVGVVDTVGGRSVMTATVALP
jgi:hypothetical protein